jgi:hypothetical protein
VSDTRQAEFSHNNPIQLSGGHWLGILQFISILTLPEVSVKSHKLKGSVPLDCPTAGPNHMSGPPILLTHCLYQRFLDPLLRF